MPRKARNTPGGIVYHVLNRANGGMKLFKKEEDFIIFEQVMKFAFERAPIRILGWCMMRDDWHLILWPKRDGELSAFVRKLTQTHAQRWKQAHKAVGEGHLYRGRFKSFPIQEDAHLLSALRFVEQGPVLADEVKKAEDWKWGSCYVRRNAKHELAPLLADWPIDRPSNWSRLVNQPQTKEEAKEFQVHIARGRPLGDPAWMKKTVAKLGLESSIRSPGRPPGWRKDKAVNAPAKK